MPVPRKPRPHCQYCRKELIDLRSIRCRSCAMKEARANRVAKPKPIAGPERQCIDCNEIKPISQFGVNPDARGGRQIRCRNCMRPIAATHTKHWRERHPERTLEVNERWAKAHPEVARLLRRSVQKVRAAIERGDLVRPDQCSKCGSNGRIDAAHEDYSKPLTVTWLCRSCHVLWDKAEPKTKGLFTNE